MFQKLGFFDFEFLIHLIQRKVFLYCCEMSIVCLMIRFLQFRFHLFLKKEKKKEVNCYYVVRTNGSRIKKIARALLCTWQQIATDRLA